MPIDANVVITSGVVSGILTLLLELIKRIPPRNRISILENRKANIERMLFLCKERYKEKQTDKLQSKIIFLNGKIKAINNELKTLKDENV